MVGSSPRSSSHLKVLSIAPLNAPSWAPSKLVVAIEAITTAAEPGTVAHFVAAESGRRVPSRPSLTPRKPSRENIPK